MKHTISTKVEDIIARLRESFQSEPGGQSRKYIGENPLLSELFSTSQMAQYARSTAAIHKLKTGKGSDKLLSRLDNNEKVLEDVRDLLIDAVREKRPVSPASEWLLDNFYLIEEQIEIGRLHLPKGYIQNLPNRANATHE